MTLPIVKAAEPIIGDSRRVRPDARDISAEADALDVSLIEAAAWS
jgi:hypothetical protein